MSRHSFTPLAREFYLRDPVTVARELLGRLLLRRLGGRLTGGLVVETEAYLGDTDPGSHASRGRTPRNAPMWEVGGTAYIYRIYGVYHCVNAVTGPAGVAQAVLIRALEPTVGLAAMRRRRGRREARQLCSGPGKLCQALALDTNLNLADLTGDTLFFAMPDDAPAYSTVITTTRIGLRAGEGDDLPLRFYFADCPHVSRRDRAGEREQLRRSRRRG